MSGNTNEDIIVDGFDLGINDYMKKPVSLDEVVARVKRILGNTSKQAIIKNENNTQMFKNIVLV